jgi:hypothetical protein
MSQLLQNRINNAPRPDPSQWEADRDVDCTHAGTCGELPVHWSVQHPMRPIRSEDDMEARKVAFGNMIVQLLCTPYPNDTLLRDDMTGVLARAQLAATDAIASKQLSSTMSLDEEMHAWQALTMSFAQDNYVMYIANRQAQGSQNKSTQGKVRGYGEISAHGPAAGAAAIDANNPAMCGVLCQAKKKAAEVALKAKMMAQAALTAALRDVFSSGVKEAQMLYREIGEKELRAWAQGLADELQLNIKISDNVKDFSSLLPILLMNIPNVQARINNIPGTVVIIKKHLLLAQGIAKRTIIQRVENRVKNFPITDPAKLELIKKTAKLLNVPDQKDPKLLPGLIINALEQIRNSSDSLTSMQMLAAKLLALKTLTGA